MYQRTAASSGSPTAQCDDADDILISEGVPLSSNADLVFLSSERCRQQFCFWLDLLCWECQRYCLYNLSNPIEFELLSP